MNSVEVQIVKNTLFELDRIISIQEQPEVYRTAVVLLSAVICGPDTTHLMSFTGLPRSLIAPIRRRMIQAELWTELEACCSGWYDKEGRFCITSFRLDVLVAQGSVTRTWDEVEGQYCYVCSQGTQESTPTVN